MAKKRDFGGFTCNTRNLRVTVLRIGFFFANTFNDRENFVSDDRGLLTFLENNIKELILSWEPDEVDELNRAKHIMHNELI